jgi:hypothetical protein
LQADRELEEKQHALNRQLTEDLKQLLQADLLERGDEDGAQIQDLHELLENHSPLTQAIIKMVKGLKGPNGRGWRCSSVKCIVKGVRNHASHEDGAGGQPVGSSSRAAVAGAAQREGTPTQVDEEVDAVFT